MDFIPQLSIFEGLNFWLAFILLSIPAVIAQLRGKKIKYYGLAISLLFVLCLYQGTALLQLLIFLGYQTALVYGYRKLIKQFVFNPSKHFFIGATAVILSLLPIIISRLHQRELVALPLGFLGISYITFRIVQLLLDTYDRKLAPLPLPDYLLFILFFPTITSGPIDRSGRFIEDLNKETESKNYPELLSQGVIYIFMGLAYKKILGQFFYEHLPNFEVNFHIHNVIGYMYTYGFYLFFDFAGYSLMAVGAAYVFGISVPHNFNYPFIAKDFKDFWDRWHISLSMWFRDYVFSRFVIWSMRKKLISSRLYTAMTGYMVTMVTMGLWHGLTFSYILYGFYHGFMLSATELYQKKSKFHKKYRKTRAYTIATTFITFQLVMIGFLIFSGHFSELLQHIVRKLG